MISSLSIQEVNSWNLKRTLLRNCRQLQFGILHRLQRAPTLDAMSVNSRTEVPAMTFLEFVKPCRIENKKAPAFVGRGFLI
jgi:hypothetical protein